MRTTELKLYTASELKEKFPKSFERALKDWRDGNDELFWEGEIFQSLKTLFEKAGVKLDDWRIGAYSLSFIIADAGDANDLIGKRAMAWLENNLFSGLRISRAEYLKNRKDYSKWGSGYQVGQIRSCPLTGYCFDETLLDALRESVKSGETIKEAFQGLADVVRKELEGEYENQNSEEFFLDHADANGYEYTEDGD